MGGGRESNSSFIKVAILILGHNEGDGRLVCCACKAITIVLLKNPHVFQTSPNISSPKILMLKDDHMCHNAHNEGRICHCDNDLQAPPSLLQPRLPS